METVGFGEVLQHTPRAVTMAPPSDVTLPPQVADVWVMSETINVVTVGTDTFCEPQTGRTVTPKLRPQYKFVFTFSLLKYK